MPFDQVHKQYEIARHLPPPLYVLFVQASAYGQACGEYPGSAGGVVRKRSPIGSCSRSEVCCAQGVSHPPSEQLQVVLRASCFCVCLQWVIGKKCFTHPSSSMF